MKSRAIILLTVVAIAVAAAMLWPQPMSSRSQASRQAETATTSDSPSTPPPARLTSRWELGAERVYEVESEHEVHLRLGPDKREMVTMSITGTWISTVVGHDDDRVHVRIALVEPELELTAERGATDSLARAVFERALSTPFFLTVSRRGLIEGGHFPAELTGMARSTLKAMAATAQYVQPEQASDEWEVEETDATGDYVARYRLESSGEIRKSNLGYLRIATAAGLLPLDSVGAMESNRNAAINVTVNGAISTMDSHDLTIVEAGGNSPSVESRNHFSLALATTRSNRQLIGAFAAARADLVAESLAATSAARDHRAEADRRELAGASFTELVAALRIAAANGDGKKRAALLGRLAALLRLQPGAAADAAALAAREPLEVGGVIIGALAAASTPEAQEGLVNVVDDRNSASDVRVATVAALGSVATPTDATVAALTGLLDDPDGEVNSSAALALGAAASMRGERDQGDDSPLGRLLALLEASTSPEEQALYLEALGNTKDPRALPAIEKALASTAALVRGAATNALRFMTDPRVDQLLAAILLQEPRPGVRRNALFAVGFRSLAAMLPVVEQLLATDSAAEVRLDAVHLLGTRLHEIMQARTVLGWVLEHDESAEVREAARSLLEA